MRKEEEVLLLKYLLTVPQVQNEKSVLDHIQMLTHTVADSESLMIK